MLKRTISIVILGSFSLLANAAPIMLSPTGLSSSDVTITWSEVVLPQESAITNQYSAFGVTFSPNTMFYNTQPGIFPTDPHASNYSTGFQSGLTSMYFTAPASGVAFNFISNAGVSNFTALLNGNLVETFSAATDTVLGLTRFYGFTGITFNEIRFLAPGNNAFQIDNIQIKHAAVPEPGPLALLAAGLLSLWLSKYRRLSAVNSELSGQSTKESALCSRDSKNTKS